MKKPHEGIRLALLSSFDPACGVASHTTQVMNGVMAAARLRGAEPHVIVLAEERPAIVDTDPPHVHRCWSRGRYDMNGILERLERERVGIVHVMFHGDHFRDTDLVGFLRACRTRGIRSFGTFHFMDGQPGLAAEAINEMERAFVHNEEGARRFVAHGAEADRIRVSPLGAALDAFAKSAGAAKRALELPEDLELILAVGSFGPADGVVEILEALPAVIERHPQVQFALLGGDGAGSPAGSTDLQKCRDTAAALALQNHVAFQEESLPREITQAYLAAADVVVLNHAANRSESFAAARFVLSQGRPVVTTDVPAFARLRDCTLQTTAHMSLAQAINRLLEHPRLASRLQDEARSFLESEFFSELGERLLGEYELPRPEALPGGPGRPTLRPTACDDLQAKVG